MTRVLAANVDFLVGDGAKLTVVSVQDWDDTAVHVAQHNALIGRDATFKSIVVTFGGDVVRLHPRVSLRGPRRRGRALRPVLHRTPASTRSTAAGPELNEVRCKSNVLLRCSWCWPSSVKYRPKSSASPPVPA